MSVSYAQKGFNWVCRHCRMFEAHCLCAQMPQMDLSTRVVLYIQKGELNKWTNTGFLAHRVLSNSSLIIRGEKGRPSPSSEEWHQIAGDNAYVLFPDANAQLLDPSWTSGQKLTLICPDGHWGQAKKMIQREPFLRSLPRVRLPDQLSSHYHLRRRPLEGTVCTYEAIMEALGIIEGQSVLEKMKPIFNQMIRHILWCRGALERVEEKRKMPIL